MPTSAPSSGERPSASRSPRASSNAPVLFGAERATALTSPRYWPGPVTPATRLAPVPIAPGTEPPLPVAAGVVVVVELEGGAVVVVDGGSTDGAGGCVVVVVGLA